MNEGSAPILLIEDNPAHADLIRYALEEHGWTAQIHQIPDGEAAINYLLGRGDFADRRRYPEPDLVLLDRRLPRIDGLEVLRAIKQSPGLRHIPVVLLSSSDARQDVRDAYQSHANSYLVKPMDFARFASMLGSLAAFWLRWNRRHPA